MIGDCGCEFDVERAQVMLVKNLDVPAGYCNGTRGVVVKFDSSAEHGKLPIVKFAGLRTRRIDRTEWNLTGIGGKVLAARSQIPLQLAWAITIHKAQGMTLDRADVDVGNCFACGHVYVGVSRLRSLDNCRVINFNVGSKGLRADPRVIEFYKQLAERRAAAAAQQQSSDSLQRQDSKGASSALRSTGKQIIEHG